MWIFVDVLVGKDPKITEVGYIFVKLTARSPLKINLAKWNNISTNLDFPEIAGDFQISQNQNATFWGEIGRV